MIRRAIGRLVWWFLDAARPGVTGAAGEAERWPTEYLATVAGWDRRGAAGDGRP